MAVLQTTPVNGMTDLIDLDRASTNAQLAPLSTPASRTLLTNLISAASGKVRNFCKRDLVLTDYVTVRDGGIVPSGEIHLQYPVVSVARVAINAQSVLSVVNTSNSVQRATVATTLTGVTLFWEASGVAQTDTSAVFATYPTLTALAGQINAVGNGWSATVTSGYAQFPSADLLPTQGGVPATALSSGQGAELVMYTEVPTSIATNYFADGFTSLATDGAWRLDAPRGLLYAANLPRGPQVMRIDYRAGFAVLPDEIQEATVLTAVSIYKTGLIDPTVESVRLGQAAKSLARKIPAIPQLAKELLFEHVDYAGLHAN